MLAGFDSMKAKALRTMTLEGDTKVESILTDPATGALVRRRTVFHSPSAFSSTMSPTLTRSYSFG